MQTQPADNESSIVRRGAVAVVVREGKLLLIRRSQQVIAPGMYCFPGGGIEPGESQEQAVVRELQEELGCLVHPRRWLWESISPWRIHLAWWLCDLDEAGFIKPNPLEVESVHWFSLDEMATLPNQLETNYRFVEALSRGEIVLDLQS
jgi:8-oxo-dGTP diphosphatase